MAISRYTASTPSELKRETRKMNRSQLADLYRKRINSAQNRAQKIQAKWGERATTSDIITLPSSTRGLTEEQMILGISKANRYIKSKASTISGYRSILRQEKRSLEERYAEKDESGNIRKKRVRFTQPQLVDMNYMLDQLEADNLASLFPSDFYMEKFVRRAVKQGMTYEQLRNNMMYLAENYEEYYEDGEEIKRFQLSKKRKAPEGSSAESLQRKMNAYRIPKSNRR